MNRILEIIKNDSRTTPEEIAVMLNMDVEEVKGKIKELENDKIILAYTALVNWEKTDCEVVNAIIELRVTPQMGEGFDKIAEKIYKYTEVKSVALMSGGYDLAVTVEGKSMKDVALFVAEKLSPMECVISTATHFVLRKYKEDGIVFESDDEDERSLISL